MIMILSLLTIVSVYRIVSYRWDFRVLPVYTHIESEDIREGDMQ